MIYVHQLDALKRDAKARAKHHDIEETHALDQVARENGYSTWQLLLRQCESPLTPEGIAAQA